MEKVLGFLALFLIYIFIFTLSALLPGRWVTDHINIHSKKNRKKDSCGLSLRQLPMVIKAFL
ncbi:MAG: hypothetical protein NT092_00045 [Bacteroidia bacterium]|nr:hypothetical protein [Bacteroidia bacterium]